MFNLKKVDFIWINRDQKSFEWFVNLLSQLEMEQREHGWRDGPFLESPIWSLGGRGVAQSPQACA